MADNEAKEWLWEVYQHTRAASRDRLFTYFRGATRKQDLTPDIMNMVSTAVKRVYPADDASLSCNIQTEGLQERIIDKALCATYLYYIVAEHLLEAAHPLEAAPEAGKAGMRRFKGMVKVASSPSSCHELVQSKEFHLPLVECALHVVAFITAEDPNQHYPWATEMLQRQGHAVSLWQAARSFQECFGVDNPFPLPAQVQRYLHRLQGLVLDQAALATGSQLYSIMQKGGGCHFKEEDTSLVENVLRAYALQAVHRAQRVGWQIFQQQLDHDMPPGVASQQQASHNATSQHQHLPDNFHEQCAWLMDMLLLSQLDLCFGQHMSVVVACVVYVTAKVLQVNLTFKRVTEVITSCVEDTPRDIFQHAELQPPQVAMPVLPAEYGDVRMFYNARFLPSVEASVRQYLQDYQQMQPTCSEDTAGGALGGTHGQAAPTAQTTTSMPGEAATTDRRPLLGLDGNGEAAGVRVVAGGKASAGGTASTLHLAGGSEGPGCSLALEHTSAAAGCAHNGFTVLPRAVLGMLGGITHPVARNQRAECTPTRHMR